MTKHDSHAEALQRDFPVAPLVPALDFARRGIPSHGHSAVDFEQRVNFDRLREYRISRAVESLEASGCGAFFCSTSIIFGTRLKRGSVGR